MKMKRPLDDEDPTAVENPKKRRAEEEKEQEEGTRSFHLDDDLLFEVLKHVDARSLAMAACVSNQWRKTAQDERLWELICTRHCANTGCGNEQLRSVVRALGGFRRLHSLCLLPLLKPQTSSSPSPSSSSLSFPVISSKTPTHWGKDEIHLSLSLLSIRYYEKMNLNKRGR